MIKWGWDLKSIRMDLKKYSQVYYKLYYGDTFLPFPSSRSANPPIALHHSHSRKSPFHPNPLQTHLNHFPSLFLTNLILTSISLPNPIFQSTAKITQLTLMFVFKKKPIYKHTFPSLYIKSPQYTLFHYINIGGTLSTFPNDISILPSILTISRHKKNALHRIRHKTLNFYFFLITANAPTKNNKIKPISITSCIFKTPYFASSNIKRIIKFRFI